MATVTSRDLPPMFGFVPGVRLVQRDVDQEVEPPRSTGSIGPTGAPSLRVPDYSRRASPSSRVGSPQWRYREEGQQAAESRQRTPVRMAMPVRSRQVEEPPVRRRPVLGDEPQFTFTPAGALGPGPGPAASPVVRRPRLPELPPGGGAVPLPGKARRRQRVRRRG